MRDRHDRIKIAYVINSANMRSRYVPLIGQIRYRLEYKVERRGALKSTLFSQRSVCEMDVYRLLQMSLQKATRAQHCRSGPSLRENLLIASVVNRAKAGILSGQTFVLSPPPRQTEARPADYDVENSDDEGGDESCCEEVQPNMDVVYAAQLSPHAHVYNERRRMSTDTCQGGNCRKRARLTVGEDSVDATTSQEVRMSGDPVANHMVTPMHPWEETEHYRGCTTKDSSSFLDWSRASKHPRFDSIPYHHGSWEQTVSQQRLWQEALVF